MRHDGAVFHIDHAPALGAVRGQHGVVGVECKKGHIARAVPGHGHNGRVIGVEHGHAFGVHVEHNHPLEHRQVFQRGDVVQAQVVACAQVGDHGHLAAVKGQALAQQAAAGGLEHGGVHIGVHQHVAGAARAAAVA